MFHADGQTDITKLTVAFRNFANDISTMNSVPCFHILMLCFKTLCGTPPSLVCGGYKMLRTADIT